MNPRRREVGSEKEEYYVCAILDLGNGRNWFADGWQRLMAKDLDNWEQKRVQRFKGEPDGRL